jgi:hypothetical protein
MFCFVRKKASFSSTTVQESRLSGRDRPACDYLWVGYPKQIIIMLCDIDFNGLGWRRKPTRKFEKFKSLKKNDHAPDGDSGFFVFFSSKRVLKMLPLQS